MDASWWNQPMATGEGKGYWLLIPAVQFLIDFTERDNMGGVDWGSHPFSGHVRRGGYPVAWPLLLIRWGCTGQHDSIHGQIVLLFDQPNTCHHGRIAFLLLLQFFSLLGTILTAAVVLSCTCRQIPFPQRCYKGEETDHSDKSQQLIWHLWDWKSCLSIQWPFCIYIYQGLTLTLVWDKWMFWKWKRNLLTKSDK